MRILLIGRTGQLGGDLLRNNTVHEIIAPERAVLDVMNPDEVREALREYNPALVINCAAFHNVPLCEQQPDQAFRVNCVAMRDLAIACREADTRLVTFSSDYVFGSDRREPHVESALPHPLQIYGISRLAGEHAVGGAHVVVHQRADRMHGVEQEVIDSCDGSIEIPQLGTKHSLNISVSIGIVVWEVAKRYL